jgi:hypothetical protein
MHCVAPALWVVSAGWVRKRVGVCTCRKSGGGWDPDTIQWRVGGLVCWWVDSARGSTSFCIAYQERNPTQTGAAQARQRVCILYGCAKRPKTVPPA